MEDEIFQGIVSYVSPDKNFATIDYTHRNKKKFINCKTNEHEQEGSSKKPHTFRVGDEVSFQLKLSDRGDKQTAYNVRFHFNKALNQLIAKAEIENRFSGYLKLVEDKLFVKEIDSYLFFPLHVSPWEKAPAASASNEAISFRLTNLDKPAALGAELFSRSFIPEYKKAEQHFKNKIAIEAVVSRISAYAIYVDLFGEAIKGKLPITDPAPIIGQVIPVFIKHLSPTKIVVEPAPVIEEQ